MSAPVSNGVLRTKLSDMKIGDYIKWGYTAFSANTAGTLQEDTTGMDELPAVATETGGGYFYFIKWRQGLLIADRALQYNVSAQALNKLNYLKGSKYFCPSLDQFKDLYTDDFGGNFKYHIANEPIAITDKQYVTILATGDLPVVITQDLKAFATYVVRDKSGTARIAKKQIEFTSNREQFSDDTILYYAYFFLPCMEYVDSSKSMNIFY